MITKDVIFQVLNQDVIAVAIAQTGVLFGFLSIPKLIPGYGWQVHNYKDRILLPLNFEPWTNRWEDSLLLRQNMLP